jgi:pimeloyl-ACP methyl ester carboxylesterase
MNVQEITLKGFGGELAAKRWPGEGENFLALHGWLDNAGTFDGLAPLLPELDLVCLDLPGHGHSYHRPAGTPYHFVDWVPEVFCAADALGWDHFSLLGHSMGAAIASLAAGTFPDRISNLILIEGIGPFASPDEQAPEQLRKALLHQPSDRKFYYPTELAAIERLGKRDLEPHSAHSLAKRALRSGEQGWYFNYATEARAPSRQRLSEAQVRAFLEEITCPTLLLRAKNGLEAPETYRERHEFVSQITTLDLEGRHHLHLDTPEVVVEPIRTFLEDL